MTVRHYVYNWPSRICAFEHLRSPLYLSLELNALILTAEFIGGFNLDNIGLVRDARHTLVDQGKQRGWERFHPYIPPQALRASI